MIKALPVQWSGGVNLFADASQVRDDQLRYSKNMAPAEGGLVLGTRRAMRASRNILQNMQSPIWPLRVMASPVGGEFAIAYFDNQVIKFGTITVGDPVSPAEIAPAGVRNLPISMAQLNGETYVFTGYNSGFVLRSDDGPAGYAIAPLVFGGDGNTAFYPTGAASVRGRMVYWSGRDIVVSDTLAPTLIGDNAALLRSITVAHDTPDGITHVQELNTSSTGSPVQSVVAVWTTDAMYMILGEPPQTGDLALSDAIKAMQINKLTVAAGCVSGATVAQTPYGTIWAGPDDVWFLPFGALPVRIGTNIRPALLNTPPALRYRWHAAYENGVYRLAIDAPGAGPSEISGCQHHWLLDMRRGPPQNAESAVWWGPQDYTPAGSSPAYGPGTWCFVVSQGNDGDGKLYSLQPWVAADSRGTANGISLCTFDADQTRDEAAMNYPPSPLMPSTEYFVGDIVVPYDEAHGEAQWSVWRVTSVGGSGPSGGGVTAPAPLPQLNTGALTLVTTGDVTLKLDTAFFSNPVPGFIPASAQEGNEIVPELVTKEFVGNPMLDKLYDGATIGYWVNQKGRVLYRAITDIDENSRVLSPLGDDTAASGNFGVGQSSLPIRGQRIWQSRLLNPQVGRRYHAKSLQFRYTHDTQFIIDSTNNVAMIDYDYTAYRVEIPSGAYPTLLAVANIIVGALPGTFQVNVAGSLVYMRDSDANEWKVVFNESAWAGVSQPGDFQKCSRLFAMLGVDTNNQNWYTVGATPSTFIWTNGSPNNNWIPAKIPAEQTRTFRADLNSLALRVDTFNREPT